MELVILLVTSIISGVLYRMGGDAKYNTKFRDFGLPIMLIIFLWYGFEHYSKIKDIGVILLTGVLVFLAQLSYYKKRGVDAVWWNWALVGFFNGLALLPIAYWRNDFLGFLVRTLFLTVLFPFWCTMKSPIDSWKDGNVKWSEGGRGFWIQITNGVFLL